MFAFRLREYFMRHHFCSQLVHAHLSFLTKCIIILHYHCQSQEKNISPVCDLQNVLENFSTEIMSNLNCVKNMFKDHVLLNFIPMKSKRFVNIIVYVYAFLVAYASFSWSKSCKCPLFLWHVYDNLIYKGVSKVLRLDLQCISSLWALQLM